MAAKAEMKNKIAVVQGSFDPMTNGHVDIVRRAAQIFGRVIVVVARNVEKEYMFTDAHRAAIAVAAIEDIENAEVRICDGYVSDFALQHGADAFVRGIRDGGDVAYEQLMADVNFERSSIDTVLLFAKKEYHTLSSTVVRERIKNGKSLDGFMPPHAAELAVLFYSAYRKQTN